MSESRKYEELANEVLEIITKVGRKRVPPGMIGFARELFVLSKMCR